MLPPNLTTARGNDRDPDPDSRDRDYAEALEAGDSDGVPDWLSPTADLAAMGYGVMVSV